jgi:predicted ArsR family transcriptional regulator
MITPQISMNGATQKQMLMLLLEHKDGITVDKFVDHFGISRTAVNQHLTALERDSYVKVGWQQKTGGRPRNVYVLTDEGVNLFPKNYSWFSNLLLQVLESEFGPERMGIYLHRLGVSMAQDSLSRVEGQRPADRVPEVVRIMNETGFDARVIPSQGDETIPRIECKNCVYHDLARDHPQVCQFDLGILSTLMDLEIEHQDCMVRGGTACRFRFVPKEAQTAKRPPSGKTKRAPRPKRGGDSAPPSSHKRTAG